ncbi:restriction endonuclease [Microbacterium sp. zg.Y625]|uniref:restriction endonuclease n=1 Tax=Microbacterium jiangjiandongii TaxID=3049071 RepID=UPI00214C3E9B|nr:MULTISPECIES: restriction endonuclease [unclassified Microbacterium]MCR2791703.1 restriction endonuclease [Microbacterium sp. zg.Y625]WIM24521.1 restriction endonuclease [Microbacterium sp. zg-Y625]
MTYTWQQAESLAVEHMHALGFSDAKTTVGGADGGIDAISETYRVAAQVKNYVTAVGRPDIQRLAGAAHGYAEHLFYALSGYSQAARDYADERGIALFSFDETGAVSPESRRASELNEKHKSNSRAERVMAKHTELQRAQHLRENESPSIWDHERHTEYPVAVRRHLSVIEMWPEFEARLRALGDGAQLDEFEQLLAGAFRLFDEQEAAERVIPRHWDIELARLEAYRALVFQIESRLTFALRSEVDVRGLLDLAEFDGASRSEIASGSPNRPVAPLATQDDWDHLWRRRATVMVRLGALRYAMAELDKKGRFKPHWTVRSPRFNQELSEIAPLLERQSFWVGPDHFNVRYADTTAAANRTIELETSLTGVWQNMPKPKDRLDIVSLVNAQSEEWMLDNAPREEVRALRAAGFIPAPL